MSDLAAGLPPSLVARPPTDGDARAVTELYLRADDADLSRPDTDEDDVTAVWRWPDLDLRTDAVLVTAADGTPVGYAWAHVGHEGDLTVDPAWRGKGIGRALLRWVVDRATAQVAEQRRAASDGERSDRPVATGLELHALSTNRAAARLLEEAGFEPDRVSLLLRVDVDGAPREPDWPDGVSLRTFDAERDGRALHELISTAMADVDGTTRRSFEEWSEFTLRRSAFDPTLVLQAEAGGALVGATMSFDFDGDGYVLYLAVARPWRRRGLGLALLLHTFATFAARGVTGIELNVDSENTTGATRLYERAGMREVHRWNRWRRPHPAP
jgi:ribosomal protein S18 acetylase RimI-like enzyme